MQSPVYLALFMEGLVFIGSAGTVYRPLRQANSLADRLPSQVARQTVCQTVRQVVCQDLGSAGGIVTFAGPVTEHPGRPAGEVFLPVGGQLAEELAAVFGHRLLARAKCAFKIGRRLVTLRCAPGRTATC